MLKRFALLGGVLRKGGNGDGGNGVAYVWQEEVDDYWHMEYH